MRYAIEVAVVPVRDVDTALTFYTEQLGFALDVDYRPTADFRVVQLTPPGSACSIQLEQAPNTAGSALHFLVVPDLPTAVDELRAQGTEVTGVRHKSPVDTWSGGWAEGVDPERRAYASFADVVDPDGNRWVLQEVGSAAVEIAERA
jgi:catechol 2,3-dioxygenase-like lactoylglutathione lyase family enzyme